MGQSSSNLLKKGICNMTACLSFFSIAISCPEASFTLTNGRKTRALEATISGMRHRCRLRSEPDGQNSVIFFVIFKWLLPELPELSFSDRWSRGTKTLGTRLLASRFTTLFLGHAQKANVLDEKVTYVFISGFSIILNCFFSPFPFLVFFIFAVVIYLLLGLLPEKASLRRAIGQFRFIKILTWLRGLGE